MNTRLVAATLFLSVAALPMAGSHRLPRQRESPRSRAKSTQPGAVAATPAAPVQPVAAGQPADYRLESIGMGDMVRITRLPQPELTTEARVSERGTILFPMIGDVPVTGLTPQQVGNRIADKLRAGKYVVNPEVTVSMRRSNSRQVSVLGNVTSPAATRSTT
jgi:polysaccharide export outer membrane protein